jgi:hypothetical protein
VGARILGLELLTQDVPSLSHGQPPWCRVLEALPAEKSLCRGDGINLSTPPAFDAEHNAQSGVAFQPQHDRHADLRPQHVPLGSATGRPSALGLRVSSRWLRRPQHMPRSTKGRVRNGTSGSRTDHVPGRGARYIGSLVLPPCSRLDRRPCCGSHTSAQAIGDCQTGQRSPGSLTSISVVP